MYRDSRASIEGRIKHLKEELAESEKLVLKRQEEVAPLLAQLFPLFTNLTETLEPVTGDRTVVAQGIVLGCLSVMSVPIFPLAALWRGRRRDVTSLRSAVRRTSNLEAQLRAANETLRELK
jgi:hypothetical protein